MSNEIETVDLVETWLYSTLHGDVTLAALVDGRIVGPVAALGDFEVPFVVFSLAGTRDIAANDGTIIDTSSIYVVKAVGAGSSWDTVRAIAARVHNLIHGKTYTFPGGGSLTCARERIVAYPEEEAGQQFRHLGGQYRIRASRD